MNNNETSLMRRRFLLAAGVGSASAVVAVSTAGSGKTAAKPAGLVAKKTGSYEETRHISNYYRTARV